MERLFVWLLRALIVFVTLIAVGLLLAYFLLSRSLPEYDKTLEVDQLARPIEIVRNTSNVPHIFAPTDSEAMFGLGYVHAQDRLWQMLMLRRTAQGRLSEMFGRDTVQTDMLMRRLAIYDAARQSVGAISPQMQNLLQSYASGINTRIEEINTGALGRGAPEFFVFSNEIAPWQPADSIAILKLMGAQASTHLESEVLRARTSLMLGDARVKDILPDAPGTGVAELQEFASLWPTLPKYSANMTLPQDRLSPFKGLGLAGASNAWAALPGRSAARGTLLANDPHVGLSAPSLWYLARMQLRSGDVIGGTIPGIPAVLVGRSENLGWGITAANADDIDVYIEKLNPTNPKQYQSIDGFEPFRKRQSIVQIRDQPPVTLELLWTDNGPVLPGSHFNLGTITPTGHVTSIAWTVLSPKDTSIEAAFDIMKANSVQGAMDASRAFVAPAQNLTLADKSQIAMRTIGALPQRAVRHQTKGRMPSPGWIAQNRWQGILDQTSNPVFLNPEGGILGNTNNKFVERPFPLHVSYDWGDTQRVQRWQRLMQNRSVHTRNSFVEAQLDTVSATARTLLPLIGADLWYQPRAITPNSHEARRQIAIDLLANWNGEMNEHLPEPLIYSAWIRALQTRLIQDELGPLHKEYKHVEPLFIERAFRDVAGASRWCDVLQSAPVETCSEMAKVALDDALIWLDQSYGSEVEALRWGEAHQATHNHQALGQVPVLKWFLNIRQSTSGGDNTLQRGKTNGIGANPFLNVHAAAYRGVYDFADPDSSLFIISTGQSGHPLSRYYDNLGQLWRRGEYIPMSLDPTLARAGAIGTTHLVPAITPAQ